MKALSIHPYYAMAICDGAKSIECRSWSTDYRGDLLICSTAKKYHDTIPAHALCVVELLDVVPFQKKHLKDALMMPGDFQKGMYAWILGNNRLIVPQPVKGKLSLWEYDGKIEYIPPEEWEYIEGETEEENQRRGMAFEEKYWRDLLI